MKVRDVWKTSDTFSREMKVLRVTSKLTQVVFFVCNLILYITYNHVDVSPCTTEHQAVYFVMGALSSELCVKS